MTAASTPSTAIERLVHTSLQQCQGSAWHARAAGHVLDWLGCAAYGARTPQGLALERWLALQAKGVHPTLAGRAADAAAAAAYHGALGSALEMDDVHRSSVLHTGPVVIPAALAAASATTSGATLLSALLVGYEAMIRIGRAFGPSHYKLWHTTATAGSFGAAAAAASVLALDAQQMAHALALAGTRSGGLWQVRHESSLGKAWHMAGAAREGLAAAQLAMVGLTGPLGVLDGPSGWFAATAPDADVGCIDAPRATPWLDDMSFKPWPACRHAHPAMDAFTQALAGTRVRPEDIERIEVHSYADALRFCDRELPHNEGQARFSIQHALAAVALWGEPMLAHYRPEAISDNAVVALRPRVRLFVDETIQAQYPQRYGARVGVQLRDGRHFEAALQDTLGDPARPMSAAALEHKARSLMAEAGWHPARIDDAVACCLALPQAPNLRALYRVIQPE
jgi:2-methylcitrate dehydratase PrpD